MKTKKNEISRHRKKTDSLFAKLKNKSNHKHEYVDCLFIHNTYPHKGTYCKLCGKIGELNFFEVEQAKIGLYRQLDHDEVFEKYQNLEQIKLKSIFQDYVSIVNERLTI